MKLSDSVILRVNKSGKGELQTRVFKDEDKLFAAIAKIEQNAIPGHADLGFATFTGKGYIETKTAFFIILNDIRVIA